nr:MAG TPA: hypothetical protein [Caudoviricetes sp.]
MYRFFLFSFLNLFYKYYIIFYKKSQFFLLFFLSR